MYNGTTKFRPSTPLLTNHTTADQSNVMSLVERSVFGRSKLCRTYAGAMEESEKVSAFI